MRVRFNEAARTELDEAIAYLNARQVALGIELLDEVMAASGRILEAPDRWAQIEPGVRRIRVKRFKYALVYRITGDEVEIIAVMHLARKPGYWHGR